MVTFGDHTSNACNLMKSEGGSNVLSNIKLKTKEESNREDIILPTKVTTHAKTTLVAKRSKSRGP